MQRSKGTPNMNSRNPIKSNPSHSEKYQENYRSNYDNAILPSKSKLTTDKEKRQENMNVKNQKSEIENLYEKLKTKYENMKFYEEQNEKLKSENHNLITEINNLSDEYFQYKSSLAKKFEIYQQVVKEKQDLEEKNNKFKETISQLKRENNESKSNCSALLQECEEDLNNLKTKYDKQKIQLKRYKENYDRLKYENDQQKKDLQASSGNNSYLYKYDEINQEVIKLKNEREVLFANYQNSEIEYRKCEEDLNNLKTKYDKQKIQLKRYKENHDRLKYENDQQKKDLQDLQIKFVDSDKSHGELEMNYDELKMNYDELKMNYDELKMKYGMKSEIEKLKHTTSNIDKDDLSITSNSPTVFKDSSIILLEEKVETLEIEKENVLKKIYELEAELQKKQNAIITIRNKYKTLQSTNDELSGLTIFKAQSLSLQKQNEDFQCQLNILTKSNENLNTNLELTKNENNQLKAEIKNMKLLKFTSKPTSSISTNNTQDSLNFIDKNEVKNERSKQSFVDNEAELSNKETNNVNFQENKHVYKFPEWWYSHMHHETSTVLKKSTMNENVKSEAKTNNTRSLMIADKSILHKHDDYTRNSFKSLDSNKNSAQTFVNSVNESNIKDDFFPNTKPHSNQIYPDWWSNHIVK